MREDVRARFEWQRLYIPTITEIVGCELGPYLFTEAPCEQDMKENSDLVILQARDIRVGCRVRNSVYAGAYPYDITIRCWCANGAPTEIHKLFAGFGHAFFYAIAAVPPALAFNRWSLASLNKLRTLFSSFNGTAAWEVDDLIDDAKRRLGLRRCGVKVNGDNLTAFVFFDLRELNEFPGMVLSCDPRLPNGLPRPRRVRGASKLQLDLFGRP